MNSLRNPKENPGKYIGFMAKYYLGNFKPSVWQH